MSSTRYSNRRSTAGLRKTAPALVRVAARRWAATCQTCDSCTRARMIRLITAGRMLTANR